MFPSENPPPRGPSPPGDEPPVDVPGRDGLVSLSQASDVLGYRGQELWKMLRGAGITIHRVDWDDGRGSAIALRDLFLLRQAQVPQQPPAMTSALPPAGLPPVAPGGPVPQVPGALVPDQLAAAREGESAASEFGADMERLRDLVGDAQLRNEYLSVELDQLRTQMAGREPARPGDNEAAIQHVHQQTAATIADLKNQVQASGRALEEAAEALEVERANGRELEARVKDLRSDLLELSNTEQIDDLRETLQGEREQSSRVQHDLERSLSLQRRSLARLEREKQALAERLGVRDEIERNNQRYIDRLERQLEEMRKRGTP